MLAKQCFTHLSANLKIAGWPQVIRGVCELWLPQNHAELSRTGFAAMSFVSNRLFTALLVIGVLKRSKTRFCRHVHATRPFRLSSALVMLQLNATYWPRSKATSARCAHYL